MPRIDRTDPYTRILTAPAAPGTTFTYSAEAGSDPLTVPVVFYLTELASEEPDGIANIENQAMVYIATTLGSFEALEIADGKLNVPVDPARVAALAALAALPGIAGEQAHDTLAQIAGLL